MKAYNFVFSIGGNLASSPASGNSLGCKNMYSALALSSACAPATIRRNLQGYQYLIET